MGKKSRRQTYIPFHKLQKNKAYFKRYQTKFRRRREGKTDYFARKRLITQAKNKYNSPKYRLVVRFSNRNIRCQIVYSKVIGDVVMCSADSRELPRYGIQTGLTNYAAAYATGLLVARRHLQNLGLADKYVGKEEVNGEDYQVEPSDDGRRPFKCLLDIGLARASTGAKIFAAMKGAVDGGLDVPHSEKRFVGYDEGELDSDTLRKYLFGGHVADYMRELKEENEDRYKRQFSSYIKAGIGADDLEGIYEKAYAAIRQDPARKPTGAKVEKQKSYKRAKISNQQRKNRVKQLIANAKSA